MIISTFYIMGAISAKVSMKNHRNSTALFSIRHYEGFIMWLADNYSSLIIFKDSDDKDKDIDISLCSAYEFDDWYNGDRLDKIILNLALTCKDFNYLFNRYKCSLYLNAGRIMIWTQNNIIYRQTFSFGYHRVVRQCTRIGNNWYLSITKPMKNHFNYKYSTKKKTPDKLDMKKIYFENAFVGESVCGNYRYLIGSDLYQNEVLRLYMIDIS